MFTEKVSIKVSIQSKDNMVGKITLNEDLVMKILKNILERAKKETTHE
jgi:hypothetical protein